MELTGCGKSLFETPENIKAAFYDWTMNFLQIFILLFYLQDSSSSLNVLKYKFLFPNELLLLNAS